jgi:hypothetical protein
MRVGVLLLAFGCGALGCRTGGDVGSWEWMFDGSPRPDEVVDLRVVSSSGTSPGGVGYRCTFLYPDPWHLHASASFCVGDDGSVWDSWADVDERGRKVQESVYDTEGLVGRFEYGYLDGSYLMNRRVVYAPGEGAGPTSVETWEFDSNLRPIFAELTEFHEGSDVRSREVRNFNLYLDHALSGTHNTTYWFAEWERVYDQDGTLSWEKVMTLDQDGLPVVESIDEDGDGEVDRSVPYWVSMRGDETIVEYIEDGVSFDLEMSHPSGGLLSWVKKSVYDATSGQYHLQKTTFFEWVKNPIDGPSGSLCETREQDGTGNLESEYSTNTWTEDMLVESVVGVDGEVLEVENSTLSMVVLLP